MNRKEFPRATPESVGIKSEWITECIKTLEARGTRPAGFMVYRHGKVVAETWWKPFSSEIPHSNHSLGKSFTAALVGICVRLGLVRTDERVVDIFADEIAEKGIIPTENMKKMTLHHLLSMGTGMKRMSPLNDEWIYEFLKAPVEYEPGTHFMYNTVGACMIGAIVEKRSGMGLKEFAKKYLFDKIGIDYDKFIWLKFHNGVYAEPGTCATTEDILRLGILYMNNGSWEGEQIMDEAWTKAATSMQISSEEDPGISDNRCGYGYQLWMCSVPGVFRFDGGQAQLSIVSKELDMVVSIHEGASAPEGLQYPLDIIHDSLFRRVTADVNELPENGEAQAQLSELLSSRVYHRKAAVRPMMPNYERFNGSYAVVEGDPNIWIEVGPGGGNFFRLFYNYNTDWACKKLDVKIDQEFCTLTFNDYTVIKARFDGRFDVVDSKNVLELEKTASCAYFDDFYTLSVDILWVNGWFDMKITLKLSEDGKTLEAVVLKDTLNEINPHRINKGKLVRID